MGDLGNVLGVFLEGRGFDLHHVDAVVEVLAEFAIGDHLGQVAMGGEDDAGAEGNELVGAETAELALLEDAQELDLNVGRQLADFVEEQGAVAGLFEVAFASAVGAGIGAFFVAEELGLDEGFRNGATGDGDEGLVGAGSAAVDGAGDEFLAGAAFALDQNRGIDGGNAGDELLYILECRAGPDHGLSICGGCFRGQGRGGLFAGDIRGAVGSGRIVSLGQHAAEFANGRRTAAIAECALGNHLGGGGAEDVVGEHDHGGLGVDEAGGAGDALLEPVVVGIEIEQNDVAVLVEGQALDTGIGGFGKEFKFLAQSGGKQRLQSEIASIQSDADHLGFTNPSNGRPIQCFQQ